MNRQIKAILRRDWIKAALCAVLACYIRLVHLTSRWQVQGGEIPARLWDEGRPFILAFWHGRLLLMPYCWRKGMPISMLISQHPDGRFIAHTIRHFAIDTIVGSSSRGGGAAIRALMKSLNTGVSIGITPDGPRGPRMRASLGILRTAKLAGVPILPCSFSVTRRRVLSSWDRLIIALPFSRGVFICGEPITVARDASDEALEAARQLLEDRLSTITAATDRLCGVAPVEPAPALTASAVDRDDAEANDDSAASPSQAIAGRS